MVGAGPVIDHAICVDPFFATSANRQQQAYSAYYPASHYNPAGQFDPYSTTASGVPPASPSSPDFGNFYNLPTQGWAMWDGIDEFPGTDALALPKTEPIDSSVLSPASLAPSVALNPAIDPMDLTNLPFDDASFGCEGINDTQTLFQNDQAGPRGAELSGSPERMAPSGASSEPLVDRTKPSAKMPPPPRTLKRKSRSSGSSSRSQPSSSPPVPARRPSKEAKNQADREAMPPPPAVPAMGQQRNWHNMIEKRYRTNLNDKIAALRDSVPSLRVAIPRPPQPAGGGGGDEDEDDTSPEAAEDLEGLVPASKLNKGTILSKAAEYIVHLEKRNQNLARQNDALRDQMMGFRGLVMNRDVAGNARAWN